MRGRNNAKRNLPLRLTTGLSVTILLTMGVGAVIMIFETVQNIQTSTEAQGLAFSRSFAMIGGQAVLDNLFLIQEAMDRQIANPNIREIDVIDTDDMIVAAKHPERIGIVLRDDGSLLSKLDFENWQTVRSREHESLEYLRDAQGRPILVIAEPLFDHGKVSAWIRIVFSLSHFHQRVLLTVARMVVLALVLIAAGIVAMRLMLRHMTRFLHQIVVQLREALTSLGGGSNGDFASQTPMTPEDEMEHLMEAVTSTTGLLKTQSDSLRTLTASMEDKVRERTAELNAQRHKAEEASRLKSAFLANLNHALRTPLNGVLGMVGMLSEKTTFSGQQREQFQVLRSCAECLGDLINGVLNLSKIEAGKMELASVSFELRATLERVMDILAFQAAEKGIELVCRTDKALPRFLNGDLQRLKEILLNLTGNALKFTRAGEVEVRVQMVEASPDSVLVKFSVRDSGIGIPRDKLEIIFEPFAQLTVPSQGSPQGTGLGLAISRKLANRMGGTIGVESELGVGSTFWFTARFEKGEADDPLSVSIVPELIGTRVLIIDDNATCRLMLAEVLKAEGALPQEASDSERGLLAFKDAAASRHPFNLVLLGEDMPGFDMEQAAEVIRAGAGLRPVPVILMSSVTRLRETWWLLAQGFAAGLTKPIMENRLLAVACHVLRQSSFREIEPASETTVTAGLTWTRRVGRILLVEDNEANQMVVKWFLHETGYQLDIVSTGQDALHSLDRQRYDLVLLDIHLPDLDGGKVVEIIRGSSQWAHLPILAITAAAMHENIERLVAAGLTGYLVKPLDRTSLLSAIDDSLASAASRHR